MCRLLVLVPKTRWVLAVCELGSSEQTGAFESWFCSVRSVFIVRELAALTLGIFSAGVASRVSMGFFQTAFGAKTNKILSLILHEGIAMTYWCVEGLSTDLHGAFFLYLSQYVMFLFVTARLL